MSYVVFTAHAQQSKIIMAAPLNKSIDIALYKVAKTATCANNIPLLALKSLAQVNKILFFAVLPKKSMKSQI